MIVLQIVIYFIVHANHGNLTMKTSKTVINILIKEPQAHFIAHKTKTNTDKMIFG